MFDVNQRFQKPPISSKEVFVYVSTKRAAHKMSNVSFFKLFKLRGFKSLRFCQRGLCVRFH
eukprot:UN22364